MTAAYTPPPLDPIPVYIGDDWSFAFTYREGGGNGAPVDLTGVTIAGELYPPYQPSEVDLTAAAGQAGAIDAAEGKPGLGVSRSLTVAYKPAPIGGILRVILIEEGLRQTIGVWPLWVLDPRDQLPAPIEDRQVVDPISGRILTFDGPTSLFPFLPNVTTGLDLSQPLSPAQQPFL